MFKINRRTDYAVRVMLCLARREAGARLPTQLIQQEMQIPRPFLQRIVADLSRVGLVNTFAGPGGGLELAHPAALIHLRHIWEAIEGPLLISDCLEGTSACPLETGCPVNQRWMRLQNLITSELETITLDSLAEEAGRLPVGTPIQALTGPLLLSLQNGNR
jgi:Rrf2 family protein